jgi:hypothetical protein
VVIRTQKFDFTMNNVLVWAAGAGIVGDAAGDYLSGKQISTEPMHIIGMGAVSGALSFYFWRYLLNNIGAMGLTDNTLLIGVAASAAAFRVVLKGNNYLM